MIQGLSFLIIEDEPALGMTLRKVLSGRNEVFLTGSLADAQAAADGRVYDVVLLDRGLPDGNGISLIPVLRKGNPAAAVIVLTGDTDYSPVREAIAAGADDYLVKSDQLIADLWVRIPIAVQSAARRAAAEDRDGLPECRLPSQAEELSPDHYDRFREIAERDYLLRAISLCGDNFEHAASRIGIGRSTLFGKLKQYGISRRGAEA